MSKYEKIAVGIAALAMVIAIGVAMFGGKTTIREIVNNVGGVNNVSNFDEIAVKDGSFKVERLQLNAGEDQDVFTNRESFSQFVNFADIKTTGTASSSFDIFLIATSTTEVPNSHDFIALASLSNNRIINLSGLIATSTTATSTNSIMAAISGRGEGTVEIPAGRSVILYMQQGDLQTNCGTGVCEAATSSSRGFNVDAFFTTYSTSTVR